MKKIYLLWIALFFLNKAFAQNSAVEIEWSKIFGSENKEALSSALKTTDDYLLFAYQSFSDTPVAKLMKLDLEGNLIWENEYDSSQQILISDIQELPNGDFLIVLTSEWQDVSDEIYSVKRISGEGEEIWSIPIQGLGPYVYGSIQLLLEEDFVIVHSFTNLFKISLIDGAHLETIAISDPNYITMIPNILKHQNKYVHFSDVAIYILNENIEIETIKLFPHSFFMSMEDMEEDREFFEFMLISKVIPTSDGGFLVIGIGKHKLWNAETQELTEEEGNYGVIKKFNADLEIVWDKGFTTGYSVLGFSGFNFLRDVVELSDGKFILTGGSTDWENNGVNKNDIWMFEIDSEGEVAWTLFFGGSEDEDGGYYFFGTKLIALADEDFVIATHTPSTDGDIPEMFGEFAQSNIWVFRTQLDRLALDIDNYDQKKFTFYPNPTRDFIYFEQEFAEVKVYNLSGKLVKTVDKIEVSVDLSQLSNGTYFLQTTDDEGGKQNYKVIKN